MITPTASPATTKAATSVLPIANPFLSARWLEMAGAGSHSRLAMRQPPLAAPIVPCRLSPTGIAQDPRGFARLIKGYHPPLPSGLPLSYCCLTTSSLLKYAIFRDANTAFIGKCACYSCENRLFQQAARGGVTYRDGRNSQFPTTCKNAKGARTFLSASAALASPGRTRMSAPR